MRRREFITVLGGAAAWPLAASAQPSAMPLIGFLDIRSPDTMIEDRLRAFRQGLKDTGYVERENVAVEYRWAENRRVARVPRELPQLRGIGWRAKPPLPRYMLAAKNRRTRMMWRTASP